MENSLTYGKGGNTELKLDLAMPEVGPGPFPAIVCIHGGSWKRGQRQDLSQLIKTLAGRGFVAVTISYRLSNEAQFPGQLEDCKAAVRWLRANAATYKIDPAAIGVIGFSAGAHLACLVGLTDSNDGFEGKGGNPNQSSSVRAVVNFFGPTDLTTPEWQERSHKETFTPFLGGTIKERPDLYRRASPVSYVRSGAPAFLVFHGTKDRVVSSEQSRRFATKLQGAGVPVKFIEVDGEGHGWGGDKFIKSMEDTITFLEQELRKPKK